MGFEFFKKYGGQRLNVRDGQSIESGMSTESLRDELNRYRQMADTNQREDGTMLRAGDRADILRQAARFQAELLRRGAQ